MRKPRSVVDSNMSSKTQKALRNLKMGIYTPILFGLLFILSNPVLNFVDQSGDLAVRYDEFFSIGSTSRVVGGMLLFWGLNTLVYFSKYTKSLRIEAVEQ